MTEMNLLQRMANQKPGEITLDDSQVRAIIEMVLPKVATSTPGMPPGMTCEFLERTDKSWTIKITRP